ncbi:hypothetical protein BH11PLA2_BH11PLA2_35000 [soil metagenome]
MVRMLRSTQFLTLLTVTLSLTALRAQEKLPVRDPLERPLTLPIIPPLSVPSATENILTAAPLPDPRPTEPPLGFSGPSRIQNRSGDNAEYQTVEDRWRLGMPEWFRGDGGQAHVVDSPYMLGRWWDPYNLNMFKGDYPIYGQHTFLNVTASTTALFEFRQIPTATTPFETTARQAQNEFFGRPNQFLYSQPFFLSFDLFHGDAGFKPVDWRLHFTPAFNVNYIDTEELSVVNADPRRGTDRGRTWLAMQEWFGEAKLCDIGSEYDFLSLRVGSQPFSSDFRGFIYSDVNSGVRLFGNANGNRDSYNLAYFRQLEKDTNSGLNTYQYRDQNIVISNWYRQDFLFPGYTAQASVHYNNDGPSTLFDKNNFLVRPDPVGVFQPHRVEVAYLGLAGDGHIGRFNISHAAYLALGRDSLNPLAGQKQSICGQMAALELSYDRDWVRFRASGMWQSGDGNINNAHATGFDSILDNTNFAGEFSFWNRQNIPLFGVQLVQRNSLYNSLRSSKIQGQSNFVNPGLQLINLGVDFDVTPRLRFVNNVNFLWFDKTNVLEQFVYQPKIDRQIGTDISTSFEYRPVLNNNVIINGGAAVFLPDTGFRQLYNRLNTHTNPLAAVFLEVTLLY